MLVRQRGNAIRLARFGLIAVCATSIACSQFNAGDKFVVAGAATLYLDEQLFRDAVDREKAGVSGGEGDFLQLTGEGRLDYLGNGATVEIVGVTSGGAKVVVSSGSSTGKVGWILADKLKPESKR